MNEGSEKYAKCRGAKIVELIAVEINEGEGTAGDPMRRVLYLYDKEGNLVAQSKDDYERLYKQHDFMIIK